jgi:hypothetical protein
MSLYSLTKPPTFAPNSHATNSGWVNPDTGEILVALPDLMTRQEALNPGPHILSVTPPADGHYAAGSALNFVFTFSEPVTTNNAYPTPVLLGRLSTSMAFGGAVTFYASSSQSDQNNQITFSAYPADASRTGTADVGTLSLGLLTATHGFNGIDHIAIQTVATGLQNVPYDLGITLNGNDSNTPLAYVNKTGNQYNCTIATDSTFQQIVDFINTDPTLSTVFTASVIGDGSSTWRGAALGLGNAYDAIAANSLFVYPDIPFVSVADNTKHVNPIFTALNTSGITVG